MALGLGNQSTSSHPANVMEPWETWLRNALQFADDDGNAPYTHEFIRDGSADDDFMSLSWVLSMLNETTLERCLGPSPGHKSSFCSRLCYGILSVVQFLHHLFEFCKAICVGPHHFVTDNQDLITTE
jgi:hypothetical protein